MLFHSQPGLEYTSFYSCGHLQRRNKQDIMVNEGKGEKKSPGMGPYYLRQTCLKLVKYKVKHFSMKLLYYQS